MTSIRKFVYAAVLAATAFNFAPSLAAAEEPAHGSFTLAHDVRWGAATVPAGDYEFSYDPASIAPLLTITKMSGARASFMLIVATREDNKSTDSNRLVLETVSDVSYVSAMQLSECGMTLFFRAPRAPEKQIAKVVNTASLSGQ